MPAAPLPSNESERLQELCSAALLDSEREFFFDECVAAVRCSIPVPIALISLVDDDRQWFMASSGLEVTETPRTCAFCAYAILNDAPLIVADARQDTRFLDNPLVTGRPHLVSYAGAPILMGREIRIGTVCAIDTQPHDWTHLEISELVDVASLAASYIALRGRLLRKNRQRYHDLVMCGGYVPD